MQKCMHTLLLAGANAQLININGRTAAQWADVQGQPTTVIERVRQHAAPTPPIAASLTAASPTPPDAGELAVSSSASLRLEIYYSAGRGELHMVVKWLREGGLADALCPVPTNW